MRKSRQGATKYDGCTATSRSDGLKRIVTPWVAADTDDDPTAVDPAQSMIAAWATVQDTGERFLRGGSANCDHFDVGRSLNQGRR